MTTKATVTLFLAALMLAALAPQGTAQRAAKEGKINLDATEVVLDNGLRVVVVNRPGVPVVSTYVWYAAGSIDETPQKTGMAHFLEHMMFKGSDNYKRGDIDAITSRNGGSNNAFTSNDYTAYYIDLPKSRYVEALKIEADRMRRLTLDQKEFDAEKKVVQSESDIANDNPQTRLWEKLDEEIYGPLHPYSHPVLGWKQDVADISRSDMRGFYDRHYHPNHATLILSGEITLDEALPAVKKLFGSIPKGPEVSRPKATPVQFKGPVTYEVKSDSELVQMVRGWPGVVVGHADEGALDVLSMILGDGVTSRLYRALVEGAMVATDVGTGDLTGMLGGTFIVTADLAEGEKREALTQGIDAAIAEIINKGVTAQEVERAKRRVVAGDIFGRESSSNIAQQLGRAQITQGDWREALKYPARVKAVTPDDVQRVAKQYLGSGNHVTGWLVPELTPSDLGKGAEDAKPQPLPIARHVLPNGLTVLLYARTGLPLVSVQASVRAGRATEPLAKTGVSAFAGALLDAGTTTRSKQEIAAAIEGVGGELGMGSGGGSLRVLSENAGLGLDLLADCMLNPSFPQAEIELARKQFLAAIEAAKNETSPFARDAASAWVYGPKTPFGQPGSGTVASVSGISRDDIVAWHKTWYRPDNTIIAVVGDFKEAEMLELLKARFGAWAKPADPLNHARFEFKRHSGLSGSQRFSYADFDPTKIDQSKKRIEVDHPEKDQVVVRLQCLGIKRDSADYIPLLVMDHILGTSIGFADRFSKKLRDEMGLAYSAYANISSGSGLYEGMFLGYIGTRPENVELALKTMYELIADIRTKEVSDSELRDSKDYLKGSFVFGLETTGQLAGLMIEMERYQLGFDYLVKYAQAVDAVTKADILRVAQKYLVPENMVEVLAGPVTKITPLPKDGKPHKEPDDHDGHGK